MKLNDMTLADIDLAAGRHAANDAREYAHALVEAFKIECK